MKALLVAALLAAALSGCQSRPQPPGENLWLLVR